MTTATATLSRRTAPSPATPSAPATSLDDAVAAASDVVARVAADDPRWDRLGPLLTAFVDAARRASGGPGSPIDADETVPPVLRARDLARLAAITVSATATATPVVEARLRSLQVAARRGPMG